MRLRLQIESINTFPHSSGIASSASSFAALSLCLLTIGEELTGRRMPEGEFRQQASSLARMGSGSAARSVCSGYALWGQTDAVTGSSDDFAISLMDAVHPFFRGLNDAILIVSSKPKSMSSTSGHQLMSQHPFAESRYKEARIHAGRMASALKKGAKREFIDLTEMEALTLHALMMSSDPGYILMEPATLEIIRKVREYREQSGQFIAFTLDAGPNVHLLYHDSDRLETERFIKNELMRFCEHELFIADRIGSGPVKNQKPQV